MRNKRPKLFLIDFLFTLSLFGVFTVCALLVVIVGANVYRSIVNTQETNAMKRTSLAYVAEKIRQNDEAGNIRLGDVDGAPALVLSGVYGKNNYSTYIYQDGTDLKELFIESSAAPSLIAGHTITEVSGFSIEQASDALYRFSCTDTDGETLTLYVNTHT